MSNYAGQRIPLPQTKGRNNALNVGYLRKIVRVCNAILNLRVKGGKFLISDENSILDLTPTEISASAAGDFPFQITQVGTWPSISVTQGLLTINSWPPIVSQNGGSGFIGLLANNFDTVIAVPPNETLCVVYLDFSDVNNVEVKCTATDDGSWASFGFSDDSHFVIGLIDSDTESASEELVIQQTVTASQTWLTGNRYAGSATVVIFQGGYSALSVYNPLQSWVQGTTGAGFPFDGLYYYNPTGINVGPGGNWVLIAKA